MVNKQELENLIIHYGKLMGEKNFTPGYSGNISARYEEGMLITTSGSANGYLKPEHIVYTDFDGNSLEQNKKPSSENHFQNNTLSTVACRFWLLRIYLLCPKIAKFPERG